MAILIKSWFKPGKYNNYAIAGNICNAFALGEIGSQEDFFLVGTEPIEESFYPLLTGNILDSEGNVLFRLVRNILAINPFNCSKILGDHVGYEIHDGVGNLILKVRTIYERLPKTDNEMFVTTLTGNFYNKQGKLIFTANSGEENEHIDSKVKCIFGCKGNALGLVVGMSQDETDFVKIALNSRGKINEPIRGHIDTKEITLDGKALINAKITNCKVHISSGNFVFFGHCEFANCDIRFHDEAETIKNFVEMLYKQKWE